MTKVHKKLTPDQVKRGVVFSSTLSEDKTERLDDIMHEVVGTRAGLIAQPQRDTVARLLDDKFFNDSHYNFNIIRRA